MPDIPMPKGIAGLRSVPKTAELLVNMFWTDKGILRTPGIELIEDTEAGVCRGGGLWYVDNNAYFVIGTSLWQLDAAFNVIEIGTIPGTAPCFFSPGQTTLAIIVSGGNGYIYNSEDGLIQITDPDFIPSISVDYIDGRHVFVPFDGSPTFFSDVDLSGSINPLSFFDAEELPDVNKYTINVSNQLYIMGEQSTEIYRTTGDATNPFMRRDGGRVDVGYVAGCVRYKNTFAFIGKRREQSYGIYAMSSGDVIPIANDSISEWLNTLPINDIVAAKVNAFEWLGYTFLAWTIADKTITFVDGNWIYQDSDLNGVSDGPWRANGVVFAHGAYCCGDISTGKIGLLSAATTEYGENFEFWLQTFARGERGSYFGAKSLELDALTGQGDRTIGLSLSRDGRIWSDFYYRSLGDIGDYDQRLRWGGGLGRYENYMGIILRGTGDVAFSIENMAVDA